MSLITISASKINKIFNYENGIPSSKYIKGKAFYSNIEIKLINLEYGGGIVIVTDLNEFSINWQAVDTVTNLDTSQVYVRGVDYFNDDELFAILELLL